MAALPSDPASPTREQKPASRKLQLCICGGARSPGGQTCPRTGWILAQPTSMPTQVWGHTGNCSQLFQEPVPPTSNTTPILGPWALVTRPQDSALPAIRLALALGTYFSNQWAGNSLRATCTLTPSTSNAALAPWPPGSHSQQPCDPVLPTSKRQLPHKVGANYQLDGGHEIPPDHP